MEFNGTFDAYITYCSIIQGIVQCQKCSSIQDISKTHFCTKCSSELDSNFPIYKFIFKFAKTNNISISEHKAIAIGRVMDKIIGFPVQIFIKLFDTNETIIQLTKKYFVRSIFRISVVGERIVSISLPKNSKITFRKFLSFQPDFQNVEQIIVENSVYPVTIDKSITNSFEKRFLDIESLEAEIPEKILIPG